MQNRKLDPKEIWRAAGKMSRNSRTVEPILGLDGEVIRSLRPRRRKLQADLAWLEEKGHEIFVELFKEQEELKSSGHTFPPNVRVENVLRRSCYIIGVQLLERELCSRLEGYFRLKGAQTKRVTGSGPAVADNPFFWCLHLLHQNKTSEKSESGAWLSRDQKTKSAKLLKYAYLNKVPPQHLIGFLLQIGTNEVLHRVALLDDKETKAEIEQQIEDRFEQSKNWREILKKARTYRNRRSVRS